MDDNEIIEVYNNRVRFDGHPDDGRGVDAKKKKKSAYITPRAVVDFFFFSLPSTVTSSVRENDTRRPTWMSERGVTVLPVKGSQRSFILVVEQEAPPLPLPRFTTPAATES